VLSPPHARAQSAPLGVPSRSVTAHNRAPAQFAPALTRRRTIGIDPGAAGAACRSTSPSGPLRDSGQPQATTEGRFATRSLDGELRLFPRVSSMSAHPRTGATLGLRQAAATTPPTAGDSSATPGPGARRGGADSSQPVTCGVERGRVSGGRQAPSDMCWICQRVSGKEST
jgi:hypothetical protein